MFLLVFHVIYGNCKKNANNLEAKALAKRVYMSIQVSTSFKLALNLHGPREHEKTERDTSRPRFVICHSH